jgi:hypothetical protein
MGKYIIAAGFGVAVLVCAPGARAEVSDNNTAVTTKTAPAAKHVSVYNPAVSFARFTKEMALTPEQQKQIKPILDELEIKLLPFKKLTFQRRGQRGAPVVKEYYQKIRERLLTEQLERFNDMVARGEITSFMR